MPVAVITYTSAQNWGGQLQAYALRAFLREQGIPAELINYRELDERRFRPKREIKDIIFSAVSLCANERRVGRFRDFRRDFLGLTGPALRECDLDALNERYSVFLTGSDQLWNCETEINSAFYLAFTGQEKRRIAYAPSFGSANIPQAFEEAVARLLGRYEALSVREKSGAAIIRRLTGVEVPTLPDPVFLLSGADWLEQLRIAPRPGRYLFVYATEPSRELADCVKRFLRERPGMQVVSPYAIPGVRARLVKDIGPREFVSCIAGAEFVVASSFHAVAFALIFRKPFAAIRHSTRSARVTDLLEELGAEGNLWNGGELLFTPPDVQNPLQEKIRAGKTFLTTHLEEPHAAQ